MFIVLLVFWAAFLGFLKEAAMCLFLNSSSAVVILVSKTCASTVLVSSVNSLVCKVVLSVSVNCVGMNCNAVDR